MNPTTFRLLFAILYISIDITYVYLSKDFYNAAAKNIQGTPMPTVLRFYSAPLAWLSMFLGWFFLVAPYTEYLVKTKYYPLYRDGKATELYIRKDIWENITAEQWQVLGSRRFSRG